MRVFHFRNSYRLFSLIIVFMLFGAPPYKAQASIQLETWQSFGGMAEQGATFAAFARLMELQGLVDPRLGKLWQERHRYAGSVITKAAALEGIGDLTSADIGALVDRYAAWLMTNLTETGYSMMMGGDAHATATKMVRDVCKDLYQRADQSIVKAHPDLAHCAVAGNCTDPAAPNIVAIKDTNPDDKAAIKTLLRQNLALQQQIDILEASTATTALKNAGAAPLSSDNKAHAGQTVNAGNAPEPTNPARHQPEQVPAQMVGMSGFDIAFDVAAQPAKAGYRVHVGTYRDETDAHRAHHQIEKIRDSAINNVYFSVLPRRYKNGTQYDLVSAPLTRQAVSQLCAVLWQQKYGCSASFVP